MQNSHLLAQIRDIEIAINQLRTGILNTPAEDFEKTHLASGIPSLSLSQDGKVAIGKNGLNIEYRGEDSCPYGKTASANRLPFEALVLHHNRPSHTTDWLVQYQIDGDPSRGGHFGYHFYIDPDGSIIQGAPLTKRTNHVKPPHRPQRRTFGNHASNRNAIGITCVAAGTPVFKPTSKQLQALNMLAMALCNEFGIEFDHIYGHGELQTDRHKTEGRSAAEQLRSMDDQNPLMAGSEPVDWAISNHFWSQPAGFPHDDVDDSAIDAQLPSQFDPAEQSEFYNIHQLANNATAQRLLEDADDESPDALSWADRTSPGPQLGSPAKTTLQYVNQHAIRNKHCTASLEENMKSAVAAVYGAGCTINIYSGGQDRKGYGSRRTGSIRHDDYGKGGRAADIHVFDGNGNQIKALRLAKLGQYWLAKGWGGVGHEMAGGGIHLDEWVTPPPGGGMYWTYSYSNSKPWGKDARRLLELGAQGQFPK